MTYKTNLLVHMKSINACLPRFGAEASVDVRTFQLEIRARNRYYHFIPQYAYIQEGKLHYSPQIREDTDAFIGWLPYFNKRWPLATDKLSFKAYCREKSLPTPATREVNDESMRDFIVKQRRSSFGYDIRGPFRDSPSMGSRRLAEDEYREAFIEGTIVKAWFWNEKLVSVETRDMPKITGNGRDSFLQLASSQMQPLFTHSLVRSQIEALARYQNVQPETVITSGATLLADFRYGSPIAPGAVESLNVLSKIRGTEIGRQLVDAGPLFWRGIPENMRDSTLYTVDAIADASGCVWFLEMNCNPQLHPDVYFPVLESLFGAAAPVISASPGFAVPPLPPSFAADYAQRPARHLPPGPLQSVPA